MKRFVFMAYAGLGNPAAIVFVEAENEDSARKKLGAYVLKDNIGQALEADELQPMGAMPEDEVICLRFVAGWKFERKEEKG